MESKKLVEQILKFKELGGDPLFYELLLEAAELHARKNHDYSKKGDPLSNLKACESLGIPAYKGVLVRLQDKWSRLVELSNKEAMVKEESVEDTLKDVAIYSLLAICLRRHDSIDKKK